MYVFIRDSMRQHERESRTAYGLITSVNALSRQHNNPAVSYRVL